MLDLVQQAVDVSGKTGRGAHGVVPQDVDHIVKSVQTVLHLRLQTQGDNKLKLYLWHLAIRAKFLISSQLHGVLKTVAL